MAFSIRAWAWQLLAKAALALFPPRRLGVCRECGCKVRADEDECLDCYSTKAW